MPDRANRLAASARNVPAVAGLALLVVLGGALLTVLGKLQHVPVVLPDELLYGNIAQSIAAGEGTNWRGVDLGVNTLFPYLLSPAWLLASDIPGGYEVAKFLSASFFTLTIIPLWIVLRKPLGGWIALIPCALLLIGPWAVDSPRLLTEMVALPIVTAAVALLWVGLRNDGGGRRHLVAAIAVAAVAILIRPHLAVLMPAFGIAILADALARSADDRRERIKELTPELSVFGLATLIGAVVLIADIGGLGLYESVRDFGLDANSFGRAIEQIALLATYLLILPILAFVALIATPTAWRDPDRRSLMAILTSLTLVLAAVAGWFLSGVDTTVVERYMLYLVPWLLAMPFLAYRFISGLGLLIAAALVVTMLAVPIAIGTTDQTPVFATARDLFETFFRIASDGSGIATLIVALLLAAVALLMVKVDGSGEGRAGVMDGALVDIRRRLRLGTDLRIHLLLGIILLGLAIPVSSHRWDRTDRQSGSQRAALPADLNWLDEAIGKDGSAAIVSLGTEPRQLPYEYTEFFNVSLKRAYRDDDESSSVFATCPVEVATNGTFQTGKSCLNPPTNVLLTGDMLRMSLRGQRSKIDQPGIGRLMISSLSPPQIQSMIEEPCAPSTGQCKGQLLMKFWTDRRSKMIVTFKGGGEAGNTVLVRDRFYDIPATGRVKIPISLQEGASTVSAQLSWITSLGSPTIESVTLNGSEIYAGVLSKDAVDLSEIE